MSIFSGYQPKEYGMPEIEKGEHKLKIMSVVNKLSANNNEMLEIKLINNDRHEFRFYIVKGDYFDQNLTRFFDCFRIDYNSTDIRAWLGKVGKAYIDKNKDNDFMGIKWLIVDYQTKYNKSYNAQQGNSQHQSKKEEPKNDDHFDAANEATFDDDDIPF